MTSWQLGTRLISESSVTGTGSDPPALRHYNVLVNEPRRNMPKTVKARFLLGWMKQHEAVDALNTCIFDPPLTKKKAIALWKVHRDRVEALPIRPISNPTCLPLTLNESTAIAAHAQRMKAGAFGQQFSGVTKVNPADLVIHQYHVITERAEKYAQEMADDAARINHCLGVNLEFKGTLVPRWAGPKRTVIDLPHFEFKPVPVPGGFTFREWDRYITAAPCPAKDRLLLWAGYHRTYALFTLCQGAGDAAGAAPLLTVMTGMPDVLAFFGGTARASVRDAVLGQKPALFCDFFDPDLFICVNLRKKRAEGRIDLVKPGKLRGGVFPVDDES